MRAVGFLCLLMWHCVAPADDLVRITYRENNYIPDGSDVTSELVISRQLIAALQPQLLGDTDRFFLVLGQLFEAADSPPEWGSVSLHTPSVEVTVVLGDRKHLFHASYRDNEPELWLDPTKADLQQFEVLTQVLRLTADHANLIFTGRK